jgi:glycosyltransferase involved in cell wall biosynthesis
MKKVLMIAYTDYKYDARVRREAETLARTKEFEVSILTPKEENRVRQFNMGDVTIIEVDLNKYRGNKKLPYIFSYLHFTLRCAAICTLKFFKRQIDIIHVHNMPDFLVFSALIPRMLGCKLILDIHDSMPETYLSKFSGKNYFFYKLLCLEESICTAIAHKVICVNQTQKDVIVGRGLSPEKVTISMNVPDPVLFPLNKSVPSATQKNNVFRMIYHGTVADRLGVDLVVQAVAELSDKIPGLQFHIWSKDGPELDAIGQLGRSLGVADRLYILPGGLPLEKLAKELKIMDLGIIGNRRCVATDLMLPVKLLEYISVSIPVVAPRLKCIQHYFSEEMISFYEPESVASMAGAIFKLYRDKEKREQQVLAARLFLDNYGWQTHQNDLLDMYRSL